jgi:hypothetical protein
VGTAVAVFMLLIGAASALGQDAFFEPNDVGADGSQSDTDVVISATSPATTTIRSASVTVSMNHAHICVVNAGADLDFDAGGGTYFFDLRIDGAVIAGTTRSVQFVQTGGDDEDFMPLSSTGFFTGLVGTHTFTLTGRKLAAGNENIVAQSSSLTVVCQKKQL